MDIFRLQRRWNLTLQRGWDGEKHAFSLSQLAGWLVACVLVGMIVLSLLYLFSLRHWQQTDQALHKLQRENILLRQKLDYYSNVIDSIYQKLDTLHITAMENRGLSRYFAYHEPGDETMLTDNTFIYDAYLDARVNSIEQKTGKIADYLKLEKPAPEYAMATNSYSLPESTAGPAIFPTFGRWADGWGIRMHPFYHRLAFHYGIDIANKMGTPIYATADGEVLESSYDADLGRYVKIRHDEHYETRYGHLYNTQVLPGDKVKKGQIIALMGSSGMSTGPHLHYEVLYNGTKVNPSYYLNRIDETAYYAKR